MGRERLFDASCLTLHVSLCALLCSSSEGRQEHGDGARCRDSSPCCCGAAGQKCASDGRRRSEKKAKRGSIFRRARHESSGLRSRYLISFEPLRLHLQNSQLIDNPTPI